MRGGIPDHVARGVIAPNREELRARLDALPEGRPFLPQDIHDGDRDLSADFDRLDRIDHIRIGDDWRVAIIETPWLRRLPAVARVAAEWSAMHAAVAYEAGEWEAWRLGMLRGEPLSGHRWLTDGMEARLQMERLPLRFVPAPAWLLGVAPEDRLLRALSAVTQDRLPHAIDAALARGLGRDVVIAASDKAEAAAHDLARQGDDGADEPLRHADSLRAHLALLVRRAQSSTDGIRGAA